MRTSVGAALTENQKPVTGCRGIAEILESGSHRDRCSFPASPLLSHSLLSQGAQEEEWPSEEQDSDIRKHTTGNYFKGIEKGDIFHYGLVCPHNVPLFLTTGSALLPSPLPSLSRSLLTSPLLDTEEEPQGEVLSC